MEDASSEQSCACNQGYKCIYKIKKQTDSGKAQGNFQQTCSISWECYPEFDIRDWCFLAAVKSDLYSDGKSFNKRILVRCKI